MKKRSIAGILAAVICAAALIYIFLWPHPLYDIAWLGVGRGDPEIVRIKRVAFGEGEVGTYDVTLSLSDSAVFLEDMRDASARFPIPGRMGSITSPFRGKLIQAHDEPRLNPKAAWIHYRWVQTRKRLRIQKERAYS